MVDLPNKEVELIARIERLDHEIRAIRRRIEHARTEADKRVLNRQIADAMLQADSLRAQLAR